MMSLFLSGLATVLSATASAGTIETYPSDTGTTYLVRQGGLAPALVVTITLVVRPEAVGVIGLHAGAGAAQDAVAPADNQASLDVTVVPPPDRTGPTVLGLERPRGHGPDTPLVLHFSVPLDPTRARDPATYRLIDLGPDRWPGTRDDRVLALRQARIDPAGTTVTLIPAQAAAAPGVRADRAGQRPGGPDRPGGQPARWRRQRRARRRLDRSGAAGAHREVSPRGWHAAPGTTRRGSQAGRAAPAARAGPALSRRRFFWQLASRPGRSDRIMTDAANRAGPGAVSGLFDPTASGGPPRAPDRRTVLLSGGHDRDVVVAPGPVQRPGAGCGPGHARPIAEKPLMAFLTPEPRPHPADLPPALPADDLDRDATGAAEEPVAGADDTPAGPAPGRRLDAGDLEVEPELTPQYVVVQQPGRTHRGLVLALMLMLLAGVGIAVRVSIADWHWGRWGWGARQAAPAVAAQAAAPAARPAPEAAQTPAPAPEAVPAEVAAAETAPADPAPEAAAEAPVVAQPVEARPLGEAVASAPAADPDPAQPAAALAAAPAEAAAAGPDEIAQEAARIRAEREALEKLKQQEGEKIAQEPVPPQFPGFGGGGGFRIIIPGPNGAAMAQQHQQMIRQLDALMAQQMRQFDAEFEAMARAQDQMLREMQARAQAQARARARGNAAPANPRANPNGPRPRGNGNAGAAAGGGGFANRGFDPMMEAQRDFERFAGGMIRDMLRDDALRAAPFPPPPPGLDHAPAPAPRMMIPPPPVPGFDADAAPAPAPKGAKPPARNRNDWIRQQTQA